MREDDGSLPVAQLPQLWRQLGLPGAIDIHTHFMPHEVMAKVWRFFDRAEQAYGREWPIQYRHQESERLSRLRGFGVRRFTSMIYPHKAEMAEWLNAWGVQFAARTPDCAHTATFFPEPSAASYVERALHDGAEVFKVHLQVGEFDPNDPLLDDVWGMVAESNLPVVLHCGSGPIPGAHTGPAGVERLLERFSNLKLVIAHMGMPEYAEFLGLAERFDGVHLDTTMAFTGFAEQDWPFPPDLRPRLQALGDRVVWGSDYPNIPYPYGHGVAAVVGLDLGDDWLRRVFWENGARLIGEPAPQD